MEAARRLIQFFCLLLFLTTTSGFGNAADVRTRNFIVSAPNQALAQQVAQSAERFRSELAKYWLGQELRPWSRPCPIRVIAGPSLAAQGVTTYNRNPVRDFQMEVVGTPQRILDSVLPHEVTHTVLATYFGRPLPRWADEGICTTVEHVSERTKHEAKLREFLRTRRGIAMNQLFLLTEYPSDVLPMYAQGYSVCSFLIAQKGPRQFVQFLKDYMQEPSWTSNIQKHYGYQSLRQLQEYWLKWVESGSGDVNQFVIARPSAPQIALASAERNVPSAEARPANNWKSTGPSPSKPVAGTALAEATEKGWYHRVRDQHIGQAGSDANSNVARNTARPSTTTPPSIEGSGRYSVSQPQAELSGGNFIRQPANTTILR